MTVSAHTEAVAQRQTPAAVPSHRHQTARRLWRRHELLRHQRGGGCVEKRAARAITTPLAEIGGGVLKRVEC